MADELNPAEETAADADYNKKFNRTHGDKPESGKPEDIKDQEASPDTKWKASKSTKKSTPKKGIFRFAGRHAGVVRTGSAFAFVVVLVIVGVGYSSVFAPNILLVNIKEMYTNDLADATIALDAYYKKLMNYKIGRPQCGEKDSIKCKLSTMSRAQKKSFEKNAFTVLGSKVDEDNRDDGQSGNDKDESRYQVATIIPPIQSPGVIATGDMMFLYSKLSDGNKALVYNVFNPKSGFFLDTRFKQVLKSRYNMTKSITVGGTTEKNVDKSFDSSVRNGGGIDLYGRPSTDNGISLGSLSSPVTAAQLLAFMAPMALQARSFGGLQCSWYSFGKAVTNDAKSAKAATVARFALQYLKQADAVKAGWAQEIPTNALSSKLAANSNGDFSGANATDSSMYKHIVYGNPPIPSVFGLLYYLDTFDIIAAFTPAWSQIMASAAAQGAASHLPGQLLMPPANLAGGDRDYCLEAEKQTNHDQIKTNLDEQCIPQTTANAPPGFQGAITHAEEVARQTCPIPHDHIVHDGAVSNDYSGHGLDWMIPTLETESVILSPYVAGLFSVNAIAWANIVSLLFNSQTKGVAASDAIFAGTGQVLGDMAMSRGMMPSNAVFMTEYLAQKDDVYKEYEDVARINARKNPFDVYNQFSFLGSIVHGLTLKTDSKAPLLSALTNSISLVGDGLKHLVPGAKAIYYLQPDPFNPLRMSCPDPEYLAIQIMADVACNVRYSFSRLELAAQIDTVLDYMTKEHSDAYQDKIDELTQRVAEADTSLDGEKPNVARMLAAVENVANKPFVDDKTGKAIAGSEYDKFLDYCVNRQDPWGRSAVHVDYKQLSDDEIQRRRSVKKDGIEAISPNDPGNPYSKIPVIGYPSIVEGAEADQDWYTGKKCVEQSEMLTNFRAYTMICSIDGTLAGSLDCSQPDNEYGASYLNPYFMSNDILYTGS